jgi:hypothetical protein
MLGFFPTACTVPVPRAEVFSELWERSTRKTRAILAAKREAAMIREAERHALSKLYSTTSST